MTRVSSLLTPVAGYSREFHKQKLTGELSTSTKSVSYQCRETHAAVSLKLFPASGRHKNKIPPESLPRHAEIGGHLGCPKIWDLKETSEKSPKKQ